MDGRSHEASTAELIGEAGAGSVNEQRRRSVTATTIGNVLEWYDFIIFAYFAPTLGAKFFPATDAVASLLSAFAVFAIGFLMRPIGGIAVGRFADRAGRKPALLLTVFLMGTGTVLIGVLPGYAVIGLTAPILLTFARLIQGFSAGGEWGSAAAFLVEWAPSNRRGLYGSVQALSTIVGVLLGSGVAALLSSALGKETIDAWAWRIPFLIGGVIGIVGLYMRSSVKETPVFRADAETATAGRQPNAWGLAARVFALSAIPHSFFYVGFAYFPTFVQTYAKLGRAEALWSNTIGLSSLIVLAPLAGLVSDRIGRRPMLIASALVMLVAPYLLVQALLSTPTLSTLLTVQLLFAAMHAVTGGCIHATFVEMLPTSLRLLIISSAYNLAGVVFGAFAPYFSVWIIRETGKPIAVSYLVIVAAVISGLGVIGLKETAGKPLR